jgi:cysteine desulfurase
VIHLDGNAGWATLPEAREAMLPWLGVPANPSSPHRFGQVAAAALDAARADIAAWLGRPPEGVVFTSGATEANHLGLVGLAGGAGEGTVAIGAGEHPCVHAAAVRTGRPVLSLPLCPEGRVHLGGLDEKVVGIALQAVSHETGVVQPVGEAAAWARSHGAFLHVDAAQAAGRLDLCGLEADAVVVSGAKIGGPVGIGVLSLRVGGPFPALFPGTQEGGRRAGTTPVALAVGFAAAARVAEAARVARVARWKEAQAQLEAGLRALGVEVVGAGAPRVPTATLAVLPEWSGVSGELAVQVLDLAGVAISTGAACASGAVQRSPTLVALGHPGAERGVRFSFGPEVASADVDAALVALGGLLRR